jgi:RND family efflux transporter MFP subunit
MAYHALLKDKIDQIPKDGTPFKKVKPLDWISLASLLVILVIFVYAGYFTREFMVDVSKVSREYPFQEYTKFTAGGKVVAEHRVPVSPRIAGQLAQIMVDKGSLVKKGQVIARLESTDAALLREQRDADLRLAMAKLDQAALGLNEAQFEFGQCKDQYTTGSISESAFHSCSTVLRKAKSSFDVAQATVNAQSAALRSAEAALDHTEVRAPFDGAVLSRDGHVGDTVDPRLSASNAGRGIVTLADLSSLEIEVEVPPSENEFLKIGQPCMIVLDALQVHLRGEVASVTTPAGSDKRGASVMVRFIDRDVRVLPEMRADVAFLNRQVSQEEDKPLIFVYRSSLVSSQGGYSVFVVRGEKAIQKMVRIGRQLNDKVQICQGIADGDMLVANPPEGMKNGSRVLADKD